MSDFDYSGYGLFESLASDQVEERRLGPVQVAVAGGVARLAPDPSLGPDAATSQAAGLAVAHGLAVYRASLDWTGQAISVLSGRTAAS